MEYESTHATTMVRLLLHGGRELGLAPEVMLGLVGLCPDDVDDPDGRVPRHKVYALWDRMVELTGDPMFGLHLAERAPAGALGLVEYASRNCRTMPDALETIARYVRLVHDAALMRVFDDGPMVRLRHRLRDDPLGCPRANAEWIVAQLVVRGRDATGVDWAPRSVAFQHPRPDGIGEYVRVFRCMPRFDSDYNELVIDRDVAELPMKAADANLRELMRHYADQQLARLPEAEGFLQHLQRVLSELICEGPPRLADAASALGMSARTLQRRLRDEETTFQRVVTEVRGALAERYLAERELAINEIAFLLGYSEPSAFHRSFKRWRGVTPREYRENEAVA